jgi:hypothetical protein
VQGAMPRGPVVGAGQDRDQKADPWWLKYLWLKYL